MKNLFWAFLISFFGLYADQAIEVRLSTEKPLLPVYLSRIQKQNSSFDESYLDKIRQVLDFDMRHMPKIFLVGIDPKIEESLLEKKEIGSGFWKENSLAYLFSVSAVQKRLEVLVVTEKKSFPKVFSASLSGDLSLTASRSISLHPRYRKRYFKLTLFSTIDFYIRYVLIGKQKTRVRNLLKFG